MPLSLLSRQRCLAVGTGKTRQCAIVPLARAALRVAPSSFSQTGSIRHAIAKPGMSRNGVLQPSKAVMTPVENTTEAKEGHPFDLPLAVSMAGYAFHSYLEPFGADGFHDIAPDGTETVYTDPDFIKEQFTAILHLELIGATSLSIADYSLGGQGSSDPYAVVTVGQSAATSKVIDVNLNPRWDEKYFFYLRNPATDILKIDVYDKDLLTEDDELGYVVLPLSQIDDGKPHDLDLKLLGPTALKGRVQIRATVVSMDSMPEAMVEAMATTNVGLPGRGPKRNQLRTVPRVMDTLLDSYRRNMGKVSGLLLKDAISKQQAFQEAISEVVVTGKAGDDASTQWKTLVEMVGKNWFAHGTPVCFVESTKTGSQAWVYRNNAKRECVISFRGTEASKWEDIVTNANVTQCNLEDGKAEDNTPIGILARIMTSNNKKSMNVHNGFHKAFTSVENQLMYWVDSICGTGLKGKWTIYVTGHSLGGALATLFAHKLATRPGRAAGLHEIIHYTFGSPRVGNEAFVAEFDAVVPTSWRINNKEDIVPLHPRIGGYIHTKNSIEITMDGDIIPVGREHKESLADRLKELKDLKDSGVMGMHIEPAYMAALQRVLLNKSEELAKTSFLDDGEVQFTTEEERLAALEYM